MCAYAQPGVLQHQVHMQAFRLEVVNVPQYLRKEEVKLQFSKCNGFIDSGHISDAMGHPVGWYVDFDSVQSAQQCIDTYNSWKGWGPKGLSFSVVGPVPNKRISPVDENGRSTKQARIDGDMAEYASNATSNGVSSLLQFAQGYSAESRESAHPEQLTMLQSSTSALLSGHGNQQAELPQNGMSNVGQGFHSQPVHGLIYIQQQDGSLVQMPTSEVPHMQRSTGQMSIPQGGEPPGLPSSMSTPTRRELHGAGQGSAMSLMAADGQASFTHQGSKGADGPQALAPGASASGQSVQYLRMADGSVQAFVSAAPHSAQGAMRYPDGAIGMQQTSSVVAPIPAASQSLIPPEMSSIAQLQPLASQRVRPEQQQQSVPVYMEPQPQSRGLMSPRHLEHEADVSTNLPPAPPGAPRESRDPATLYVDALPADMSKRELSHIFRPFGGFREVRIVKKTHTDGRAPYNFAFAEFETSECAKAALECLDSYQYDPDDPEVGVIKLQYARPDKLTRQQLGIPKRGLERAQHGAGPPRQGDWPKPSTARAISKPGPPGHVHELSRRDLRGPPEQRPRPPPRTVGPTGPRPAPSHRSQSVRRQDSRGQPHQQQDASASNVRRPPYMRR